MQTAANPTVAAAGAEYSFPANPLTTGQIIRRFLHVPQGATWAGFLFVVYLLLLFLIISFLILGKFVRC